MLDGREFELKKYHSRHPMTMIITFSVEKQYQMHRKKTMIQKDIIVSMNKQTGLARVVLMNLDLRFNWKI